MNNWEGGVDLLVFFNVAKGISVSGVFRALAIDLGGFCGSFRQSREVNPGLEGSFIITLCIRWVISWV